jgi:hypothetical protein
MATLKESCLTLISASTLAAIKLKIAFLAISPKMPQTSLVVLAGLANMHHGSLFGLKLAAGDLGQKDAMVGRIHMIYRHTFDMPQSA